MAGSQGFAVCNAQMEAGRGWVHVGCGIPGRLIVVYWVR